MGARGFILSIGSMGLSLERLGGDVVNAPKVGIFRLSKLFTSPVTFQFLNTTC